MKRSACGDQGRVGDHKTAAGFGGHNEQQFPTFLSISVGARFGFVVRLTDGRWPLQAKPSSTKCRAAPKR